MESPVIARSTNGPASLIERALPWFILTFLAVYTFAKFFIVPFAGFEFNKDQVLWVETPEGQAETLIPGDRLVQVGPVLWDDYLSDLRQPAFEGARPGQKFPIQVERGREIIDIDWTFPGPTSRQIIERLNGIWWLAYVFWLAGTSTWLYIRPKDVRWRLLIAFNYLTAIWLATGAGPSHWHIWHSPFALSSAMWLCVPVYLHLHWSFPRELRNLPAFVWRLFYATAGAMAFLAWFQESPQELAQAGLLLALAGSLLLIFLHALFQPGHRRFIGLLAGGISPVLIPIIFFSIGPILWKQPSTYSQTASLLALPALPGAYFFAIYRLQFNQLERRARRLFGLYFLAILACTAFIFILAFIENRLGLADSTVFLGIPGIFLAAAISALSVLPFLALPAILDSSLLATGRPGQLELRPNRLVSLYLFFTLVGLTLSILTVLAHVYLPDTSTVGIAVGLLAVILAMLATALFFDPFQRFIDRRLLGIPLPPNHLLELYSERITSSLDTQSLVHLLRERLMPTLLVRQSALWRIDDAGRQVLLYLDGIDPSSLPPSEDLQAWLDASSAVRSSAFSKNAPAGWFRLAFPLQAGGELVGLWLLGRRDPDDLYSQSEIPVLQSIANQTAIALANIRQAELLHALYQANVERQEAGLSELGLLLHDEVLNPLAVLVGQIDPAALTPPSSSVTTRSGTAFEKPSRDYAR